MKKILLAVDGSDSSLRAVRHVGEILGGRNRFEVTLFYVCSVPPRLLEHGGSEDPNVEQKLEEALEAEYQQWKKTKCEEIEKKIFGKAINVLKEQGVAEEYTRVSTRVVAEAHPDVAFQILLEQQENEYDVIALGRRGLSAFKEFMFGSVTFKVVHHAKNCAVWVVE